MNPREEDCRVHMATEVVEDEDDRVAADLMSSVKEGLFFPFTMKCGGMKVPSANTTESRSSLDGRAPASAWPLDAVPSRGPALPPPSLAI
eukprot:CAMPEP_0117694142 /NCGR_PEP_ID=MMETSP0804-20121206/27284_1 /TAXON_ID=1074897 /ORGANISM="Tetraselmis astigmatica, Strain CCMP880" /LENGTH=89 /DNA_ID=CAMNT_0005507799 /DNA_START=539 /DNA_END=808 /DNA_ORIENTATION=+